MERETILIVDTPTNIDVAKGLLEED